MLYGLYGLYTDNGKLCDWQVYGLARDAVRRTRLRWLELGRTWKVPDEEEVIRLLVAQSFQESAIDKSGPPYCGFDPDAEAGSSTATGLMQILRGTWQDVQERVLKLPKAQWRPLADRSSAALCMFYGCAYLISMYDYQRSGRSWRKALAMYHDGFTAKSPGYGYADLILNEWLPLFDFHALRARAQVGFLELAYLNYQSRVEFR